jgi:dynein heavy chain, axonemal
MHKQDRAKHPGPMTELEYWNERAASLASIAQQLRADRLQKVARVLELAGSTYHPAFKRMCAEVDVAAHDAAENVRFLRPLQRYLEKLSTMDDFTALVEHFKPLLHVMLLIWKHSVTYSSSARFATLLREVCNDLIMQVRKCFTHGNVRQPVTAALSSRRHRGFIVPFMG